MASAVSMNAARVQQVAALLKRAYIGTVALPEADRKRAIRICLAYQLRDVARDQVPGALRRVAQEFGALEVAEPAMVPSAAPDTAWRAAVLELVHLIEGASVTPATDDFAALQTALQRLTARAAALAAVLHKPGLPLNALLERAARDLATHDSALEQAARESFDRVLSSLNPDELKKHVAKKALSTDAMYKAALFDAAIEKFKQIEMYHNKGRLVRDYKTAYKKYVLDQSLNKAGNT